MCVQFGEKQKIVLVRLLNKTVMVRVGGGWVPLEEFVLNNDPCKGERRPQSPPMRRVCIVELVALI